MKSFEGRPIHDRRQENTIWQLGSLTVVKRHLIVQRLYHDHHPKGLSEAEKVSPVNHHAQVWQEL